MGSLRLHGSPFRTKVSVKTPSGMLLAARMPPHLSTQALLMRQPTSSPQQGKAGAIIYCSRAF